MPETPAGPQRTFWLLAREQLFISLFKSCAESIASENGSRLAAMLRAEQNVRDQLRELQGAYNRQRQVDISDELLDIIAGIEALAEEEDGER